MHWPALAGQVPMATGSHGFQARAELSLGSVITSRGNRHGDLRDAFVAFRHNFLDILCVFATSAAVRRAPLDAVGLLFQPVGLVEPSQRAT